jgi:hypothetical protein
VKRYLLYTTLYRVIPIDPSALGAGGERVSFVPSAPADDVIQSFAGIAAQGAVD